MVTVEYSHRFYYREMIEGRSPVLTATLSKVEGGVVSIDVDAYLDSGATISLFNDSFLRALSIPLINHRRTSFASTAGNSIDAYLHRVRLTLLEVGAFDLDIGFSSTPIHRNLLGRDFFNLVQIGFRERQLEYYLNPRP